jgi:ATP-dependent RNA helicase DeaD
MEEFKKLGLSKNTINALEKKGFTEPTSIQKEVIPLLLEGNKDIIAQSQTGTGKTAGFALPILEKIPEGSKTVQAIILTPTRELAVQVAQEIHSLKGEKAIKVLAVYGGDAIGPQIEKLKRGIDIVVGTPGRVMDLQKRRALKLDNIQYAVLDEADEMLNMGFVDDIESILQKTPENKKMLLFSATIPKPILNIAKNYMHDYHLIKVEKAQVITNTVEQVYYDVNARDRVEALRRIIDYYFDFYGIIFCNTKATVDNLSQKLTQFNYNAAALHGDITQAQREKILLQFRNKQIKILVATDVAARGIDVNDLTHVVNYSLPQSPESYVHRIGRTGRAGKKGISVTLVIPSEKRKLKFVERVNKCKLIEQKLPSIKDIINNKETKIKTVINNIINVNTSKISKYNTMAKELLEEHNPEEVIAAILKFSFKNELNSNTYKNISEAKASSGGSGYGRSGRNRGRSDRGSRGRSRNRFSEGRSEDKRPRKRFNKSRSDFKSDDDKPRKRFKKPRSDFKSDDDKPRKRFKKPRSDFKSDEGKSRKRFKKPRSDFKSDEGKSRKKFGKKNTDFNPDNYKLKKKFKKKERS